MSGHQDRHIRHWDLQKSKLINTCPADVNICQDLIFHNFNNNDNLVFAAFNEAIKIYDISQCRILETVMK